MNNTNITVYKSSTDSNINYTLNEVGEFLTLSTTGNEVMHIITSAPVIVTQYTQSGKIPYHRHVWMARKVIFIGWGDGSLHQDIIYILPIYSYTKLILAID